MRSRQADLPSPTTSLASYSSDSRNGRHAAISSGVGSLLLGGRHFTVLVIMTLVLSNPASLIMLSRIFPERPTKGLPSRSSNSPGPSPTNTMP